MPPTWLQALFLAAVLVLGSIPLVRRLALSSGFFDEPAAHKLHAAPVPYLGGTAIILGVLGASLLEPRLGVRTATIALAAALLGAVGLIDDRYDVAPGLRLLAQIGAASVALIAGIRLSVTGIAAFDVVLTMVWIVGITNAFNLLDNMDGLAAGVAAAAGAAVFFLATLGNQHVAAVMAAALVGACLGFLRYNRRPATIFMGDSGSLFLGFVLAVLTIDVDPRLAPPVSFLVPLILLALPILDTTTVVLARIRRGISVTQGGKDHLSHRLVARGLGMGAAVWLLVGAQAGFGAIAVATGRQWVPAWAGAFGALLILSAVVAATRADVYPGSPVIGFPRRMKLAVIVASLGLIAFSVPAAVALARAMAPAREGARLATAALAAARSGQDQKMAADLRRAADRFRVADRRLNAPLSSLGLVVPGLSSNLRASRSLVSTGGELAVSGATLLRAADADALRIEDGVVPLGQVRQLTPALAEAAGVLTKADTDLAGVRDQPYLVPPLRRTVRDLTGRLDGLSETAAKAAEGARLLPELLGGDGPRRYFLAFQNNAELRGSGGLIGNWGELVGDGGRLRLERFGRLGDLIDALPHPADLDASAEFLSRWEGFDVANSWQQVNVSADFPTTGRIISDLYPRSGGRPVDGVIAIDPVGLASLLEVTGPIDVPAWPEPVTAANVVDVTLVAAYERFPVQEERVEFLGEVSRRTWESFTNVGASTPAGMIRSLGGAVATGHLLVYLADPEEQGLIRRLGADGGMPRTDGDSLTVVNQNLGGNKLDVYLHRRVRYSLTIDPGPAPARLSGDVQVEMHNAVPPGDLAYGVVGPYDDRFVRGENRTYVSVYSPFSPGTATLDGRSVSVDSDPELGLQAASAVVSIPARETRTLALHVDGRIQLSDDGWYTLALGHQPVLEPDKVELSVTVPSGWEIAETRGLAQSGPRRAVVDLRLDRSRTVALRVERSGWSRFWAVSPGPG